MPKTTTDAPAITLELTPQQFAAIERILFDHANLAEHVIEPLIPTDVINDLVDLFSPLDEVVDAFFGTD